jgi:hypothetical protein
VAPFLLGAGFFGLGAIVALIFVASMFLEGFQRRWHRFFGDKVVQCFGDPRQKLFGTVSLGSRDFLCLGIAFKLICVAAVVLKGFQRDGTASLGTKEFSALKISGRSFLIVLVVLLLGLSSWDN